VAFFVWCIRDRTPDRQGPSGHARAPACPGVPRGRPAACRRQAREFDRVGRRSSSSYLDSNWAYQLHGCGGRDLGASQSPDADRVPRDIGIRGLPAAGPGSNNRRRLALSMTRRSFVSNLSAASAPSTRSAPSIAKICQRN
jgi:hypothetical protein